MLDAVMLWLVVVLVGGGGRVEGGACMLLAWSSRRWYDVGCG